MKSFRKRVLALALGASLLSVPAASAMAADDQSQAHSNLENGIALSTSSSTPEGCSSEVEINIISNDDVNFPINLSVDIEPSSIEYEELSNPIYGFEYALNEEKLDFNVITSLKTEFSCFDEYDLKITTPITLLLNISLTASMLIITFNM